MMKFKSIKLNYGNVTGNATERDKQTYMKICVELCTEGKGWNGLIKITDS